MRNLNYHHKELKYYARRTVWSCIHTQQTYKMLQYKIEDHIFSKDRLNTLVMNMCSY